MTILADGRRLWRVFDNLMNNICKYAQRGTRVYLTLEERDGQAVISFKNTSRAPLDIPAEELLERFVRGDAARSGEGNGLGLSIAKSLTELQKGTLDLTVDGDLFKVVLRFGIHLLKKSVREAPAYIGRRLPHFPPDALRTSPQWDILQGGNRRRRRRRGPPGKEFSVMRVLEQLEPQGVFRFFEELCAIPHGSRNCQAVSDWCVAFAKERGLEHYQDEAGNVIIIQEATPGYEAAEPIILQGHLDMVCAQDPDCAKDMAKEGLDLYVEGGYVRARGTTLGGDDGIAVAMALAILDDPSIPHPRLEVVLTTEEEIGMLGAMALDVSPLRGRKLLNLDSEAEGVFTVSCAGGSMVRCALPVARAAWDGAALEVRIGGLAGGHSGTEIHKGRANACMALGRVLQAMGAGGGAAAGDGAGRRQGQRHPRGSVRPGGGV